MKTVIVNRWHSLVFGLGSLAFGINMIFNPFVIRHSEEELHIIGMMLEHWLFSVLFILFGALKLVGIFKNNKQYRLISLVVLVGLWTFIGFGFLIRVYQGSNNYGILFTLMTIAHAFGVAVRGRFK